MKKIGVTGGCGFIGSHVVSRLVQEGYDVVVIDDLSSGYEKNIQKVRGQIQFIQGSILNPGLLDEAFNQVDGVIHLAALVSVFDSFNHPKKCFEVNIQGTENVLQAAKKSSVQKVVIASSAAVYGNEPALPKVENQLPAPESSYAISKITNEYQARVYSLTQGLPVMALRFFNVYGLKQDSSSIYSGVISKFVEAYQKGEKPTLYGDGLQTRDFIFIQDVVDVILKALLSPNTKGGEVMNVGSATQVTLRDVLSTLAKITGKELIPAVKEARDGDIRHSVADISLIQDILQFKPKVSLEEGLRSFFLATHP